LSPDELTDCETSALSDKQEVPAKNHRHQQYKRFQFCFSLVPKKLHPDNYSLPKPTQGLFSDSITQYLG